MDIDAYLNRIGLRGPATATLDTLRQIHERHPAAIAFENLATFAGAVPRLDIDSLEQKLVLSGRGGWCFEQNLLVSHVLRALGFEVRQLAARVLWNAPDGAVRPRSHMALLVSADGVPHLVDVGFGGLTLTAPLRFEVDLEQSTPHETFRIVAGADDFIVQARLEDAWKSLYRFDLQAQSVADYEVTNWYLATHSDSHFRSNLMVARSDVGQRYALLNAQLTIHSVQGKSERRQIHAVDALCESLQRDFLLQLPASPELRDALRRVFSS
jgi:N-hydroxyarylamine O-acetyltransferase